MHISIHIVTADCQYILPKSVGIIYMALVLIQHLSTYSVNMWTVARGISIALIGGVSAWAYKQLSADDYMLIFFCQATVISINFSD